MSKSTLFIENDYDFDVFGIVSHEKSVKMCWLLNNHLDIDLKKEGYIIQETSKNTDENVAFDQYSYYYFEDDYVRLIKNTVKPFVWMKDFKQYDYIMIFKPLLSDSALLDLLDKIRTIENVLTCSHININSLKEREKEKLLLY
jgi:hypothetical protein